MKLIKVEVSIDLSRPVPELLEVISLAINSHPGAEETILRQLDQHVKDALERIEQKKGKQDEA
jgi:hypothetical protein